MHVPTHPYRVRSLVPVLSIVLISVGGVVGTASAAPGAQLWVRRYDGPANAHDYASALGTSPDGSTVFVTGTSLGSTDYDYATFAYDSSTGATQWTARYNGPGRNYDDRATALGVSPDGSEVFVTGASFGSMGPSEYATVAYDASTGTTLWTQRYNGPANSSNGANALGVSPDGSEVFVTGRSYGLTGDFDYATVAYDADTGARLWAKRYNGPVRGDAIANALGVSPDGSEVFVTGESYRLGADRDYATVAYDAHTGTRLWTKRYNGPGHGEDFATDLGVSPSGFQVIVTGGSQGSKNAYDYATVAYDLATGETLWVKRYTGPGKRGDFASALRVSPAGSEVFVTGGSTGPVSGFDYATVAYDVSTGTKLWAKRYDGPKHATDFARALEVSADGSRVFTTGNSTGPMSHDDYATVAYDASTGDKLWARRYDGPRNGYDVAYDIGVSSEGSKVFVTGSTRPGRRGDNDYATVAYRAE